MTRRIRAPILVVSRGIQPSFHVSIPRRYREVIEHARGDGETRILARRSRQQWPDMLALELSLINGAADVFAQRRSST